MTYKILDNGVERDAIPDEIAEIEARQQQPDQPAIPREVSRRRGLEALFDLHGLKDTEIEAAIVQHVTEPDAQYKALNEFRTSQTFEYERPLVVFMCTTLGLDRDALFTYAAQLP
jgi:hypothetical protein